MSDIHKGGTLARVIVNGLTITPASAFDPLADYLCYIVAPVVLTLTLFRWSDIGYPALLLTVPLLAGAVRYSRNAVLLRTESFARLVPRLAVRSYQTPTQE